MKLLISATQFEVQPYLNHFKFEQTQYNLFQKGNTQVLITGIGLLETTFQLTHYLTTSKPNFILQAGVAGAYDKRLQLGDVVEITSEQYGDLGAEEKNGKFLSLTDIKLGLPTVFNVEKLNNQPAFSLPNVSAISVNMTAGNQKTILLRETKWNAQVESMEGLALFRVCKAFNIDCAQVRAISNYVAPRNKDTWQMKPAINNLNYFLRNNFM